MARIEFIPCSGKEAEQAAGQKLRVEARRYGEIRWFRVTPPWDFKEAENYTYRREVSNTGAVEKLIGETAAKEIHETAKQKGWWPAEGRNTGEIIALIHSEVSEVLEALRKGNPLSDVPLLAQSGISQAEEELADVLIRILDWAGHENWDLSKAVELKRAFNETRGHRHGKEF